ncbi:MAG: phosphoribosyl-ATP diphosphatase [Alphaproteobacteria bacterium]|jgi:phosphoribosyl-ATP pyrophosphohydrolase|nr:phosphoribosyl-ATP diphosphatase [Alphaproteobacteria bacterium]MBT5827899.1 phosphoribosyl-ATP diphosphatase [Alphaproteobacteria bacterium]
MANLEFLNEIAKIIKKRKLAKPENSYIAELIAQGLPKITQKVGEEGVEVVIAALAENKERLISESADLIFHLMILLDSKGLTLAEVVTELENRNKKWTSAN